MTRWFERNGPKGDVVVASRVRLARNRSDYVFSVKLEGGDARRMIDETLAVIDGLDGFDGYIHYDFKDLNECQKRAMEERHCISGFLAGQVQAAGLVSSEEEISIMLNEEDHIRIQSYRAGMDFGSAYEKAEAVDDMLGNVIPYAYHPRYGFLTTCPSNAGTGLRASCILHLPALTGIGQIQNMMREVARFGLSLKGAYGEGGSCPGDIYTISNQTTLGVSEQEIIENLENIVGQIVDQERITRDKYVKTKKLLAEDTAYRSYGVLKYARRLSLKDALVLLSELRMGLALGLFSSQEEADFNVYQMMIGVQPNNLQLLKGEELGGDELDVQRACFIRDNLPMIV